jgi:hypothetical protein
MRVQPQIAHGNDALLVHQQRDAVSLPRGQSVSLQ